MRHSTKRGSGADPPGHPSGSGPRSRSARDARPLEAPQGSALRRILGSGLTLLVGLALVKLLLHLATNGYYGYFRDELYYIACGRRLDWGYVDHPPLIPLLARAVGVLFGESLQAIRLAPAVAAAVVVFLTGWMARRLGGGRYAMALAGLAVLVSPAYLVIATILTVNVFDILWWTVIQCLLIEILIRDRPRLWIWVGLVFGVGVLTKYNIAFLGLGLFVGMLLTPARRYLAQRWTWFAAGLALLICLPNLIWQAHNGWPTLEFLHNIREQKNYPVTAIEFVVMQIVVVHPLLAPIWLAGLFRLLFSRGAREVRLLGVTAVSVFLIFMFLQAKFYYLFPMYPVLFASGGVAVERLVQKPGRRWARPSIVVALVAGSAVFLPYTVPVLPIRQFLRYDRILTLDSLLKFERSRDPKKPIVYADMFGWPELAAGVARAYEQLDPAQRDACTILTSNYGQAAAIEFFGKRAGLPQPVSPHNSYYLWGPGSRPWHTVLAVGFARTALTRLFDRVALVTTVRNELAREPEVNVYRCSGLKTSLRAAWPSLKRFR